MVLARDLPAVSVVIATHDVLQWELLHKAIESVEAQSIRPEALVVAVDHNEDLETRLRADPRLIHVIGNTGPERGASATRNVGLSATQTEIVAFLDDDEAAEPDWLEKLIRPFDDPSVVGTGGRYVPRWEFERPGWFPNEVAWVVGAHHTGMPSQISPVRNVWSGNMAVRSEVFRSVGGFRVGFGKVGSRSRPEDTDLCMRMTDTRQGGHWLYVPDARIHHFVPADRATLSFYLRRCYAEGRGKVDLSALHENKDALSVEREYLRKTIPLGILGHVGDALRSLARAAAIVLGMGAAAIGGAVSRLSRAKSSG